MKTNCDFAFFGDIQIGRFKPIIFVLTRAVQRRDLPVTGSRMFCVHCQICTPPVEPFSPNRNPFKINRRNPFRDSEMSANVAYAESKIICFLDNNRKSIEFFFMTFKKLLCQNQYFSLSDKIYCMYGGIEFSFNITYKVSYKNVEFFD